MNGRDRFNAGTARGTVTRGQRDDRAISDDGSEVSSLSVIADGGREASPARVVADADVLAADLLCGGPAREALDLLWTHSWTTLVASDRLVKDAQQVIADFSKAAIADAWRERIDAWREPVSQPAGDHPALASAYHGGAMQVISFDESLTAAGAGAGLNQWFPVSVRTPHAFTTVFDPARLFPEVVGGDYHGPDREPRG